MGQFRDSLIRDLTLRGRSPKTIDAYVRVVQQLCNFYWVRLLFADPKP